MATVKKGIKLELDGKELYLKYTLNSLRVLEKEYGIDINQLSNEISMSTVQALLHTGVLKNHPELSFEEVGDLVDVTNLNEVATKITEALGGFQK